jgi:hypothetical protein
MSKLTQVDVLTKLAVKKGIVSYEEVMAAFQKNDPGCVVDESLVHARVVAANEKMRKLNQVGSPLGSFVYRTNFDVKRFVSTVDICKSFRVLPVTRTRSTKGRKIRKVGG